ncbi:MAG: ATP-binding cassette domain-containing protein [Syntrophaceae bacterium]|nr:ATP-binding cassette domain-containing protein [Syntrophaceae bacterium]
MIQMNHVFMTYPNQVSALSDITLEISPGEFVFIAGPNGSGKTTLLRILFGAERPSRGEVVVNGMKITERRFNRVHSLRRTMGIVFQDVKLLRDRSVSENIFFALEVTGHSRTEARRKTWEVLSRVGLQERGRDSVLNLSFGEQQRVAIARALINDPPLLLADEPTGNLDAQVTTEVMEIFTSLHKKGTTVLFATRDMDLIQRYPHRVVYLSEGKTVDVGKGIER